MQQKVAAAALAWQEPLAAFNRKPAGMVQQAAEATRAQVAMGCSALKHGLQKFPAAPALKNHKASK